MGLFKKDKKQREVTRVELVTERGNGFYGFAGEIYRSDVVRACMRPKVKAIGKLAAKHIRDAAGKEGFAVNPEPYMRFLLEEPNPYMTGQKLQEKLAGQLMLNNNAFALITRDENGYPIEIYPLQAIGVEALPSRMTGELLLRFYMANGKAYTFAYGDVIHLRSDYFDNDVFGEPVMPSLKPLMDVVTTTDQGVVSAIKNSAVINWLLKYTTPLHPDELAENAQAFARDYLTVGESKSIGVMATDTKAEVVQVTPREYVPNAAQMDRATDRIYSVFNTNKKIVQSIYTEDEWNSYYESEIEPVALDLAAEYTRKLFSRRERGCGNRIVFEAANLQCASISTKLNLLQMVDRGALTPNEWRATFGLAPVVGGDEPVRRLDTAVVKEENGEN